MRKDWPVNLGISLEKDANVTPAAIPLVADGH